MMDHHVLVQDWAAETIGTWQQKIKRMRIGQTNDLYGSFEQHVQTAAGGDIEKIRFMYRWYGKFVDMGVGRGTSLSDVRNNNIGRRLEGKQRGNARRAKKWYSPTMHARTNMLADRLLAQTSKAVMFTIDEKLPKQTIINL